MTEESKASRALITAGWDDVPHLDAETKKQLLSETHPYLREARSKGTPSLGAGAIYPIKVESVTYQPFPIPDYWPRAFAMDVGWNWTAALWGAWDLDTMTLYIYAEYMGSEERPIVHSSAIKSRGLWIPGCIDPAANNRAQADGERLMVTYQNLGLKLTKANNEVESGLYDCWTDLSTGRMKVASTLVKFFSEYRLYRRDEKGKIVKKKDHLMDCMRYLRNTGHIIRKRKPIEEVNIIKPPRYSSENVGGY